MHFLDSGSLTSSDLQRLIHILTVVVANTMALAASLEILLRNMPSRETMSDRTFRVARGKRPHPYFVSYGRCDAAQLRIDWVEEERRKVTSREQTLPIRMTSAKRT